MLLYLQKMLGFVGSVMVKYISNVGKVNLAGEPAARACNLATITVLASTTVDLYFLHNFHLDSSEFV